MLGKGGRRFWRIGTPISQANNAETAPLGPGRAIVESAPADTEAEILLKFGMSVQ